MIPLKRIAKEDTNHFLIHFSNKGFSAFVDSLQHQVQ
jgi:hypothetical protein